MKSEKGNPAPNETEEINNIAIQGDNDLIRAKLKSIVPTYTNLEEKEVAIEKDE